jgi:FemAB family protein
MANIVTYKEPEYWDLLNKIYIGHEWRSSIYSRLVLEYYQQRPLDCGKKLNNISFILQWDHDVVVAFLGAIVESGKNIDLLFYEMPCILVESKLQLTSNATKAFLREFDKIQSQITGSVWYRDYLIGGNVSFLTTHLLKKGAVATLAFSKVIDLSLDKVSLWRKIRKSYSSLINNGLKDLNPYVITSENVVWEHLVQFRELHVRVSGRETRSVESWHRQFELVQNNEAFIVFGELDGKLVTAGYFSYSGTNCIYGSSASRRDLFCKPLFHAIMWKAILYAKKIGCKWFEIDGYFFQNQPTSMDTLPTEKELGITDFKAGFGGDIKTYLDIRLYYESNK